MEFLLLLLPALLLGALGSGGGSDDEPPPAPEPEPEADGNIILGNDGINALNGTSVADLVLAAGEEDFVTGGEGNDVIAGESGEDDLSGGNGNDLILGGGNNDTIDGDGGNDALFGGAANDSVSGLGGNDIVVGGTGADSLFGGTGSDLVFGIDQLPEDFYSPAELAEFRSGIDRVFPEATNPQVDRVINELNNWTGTTGADSLNGGAGVDLLLGDLGDTMTGGDGDDIFSTAVVANNPAATTVTDFVPGADEIVILVANPSTAVLTLDASSPAANTLVRVNGVVVSVILGIPPSALTTDAVRLGQL